MRPLVGGSSRLTYPSYPKPLKNQVNGPVIHSKALNWPIGGGIPLNSAILRDFLLPYPNAAQIG